MNNCYSVLPKGGFTNEVKKESQEMTPTKIVEKRKTDGKLKFYCKQLDKCFHETSVLVSLLPFRYWLLQGSRLLGDIKIENISIKVV